MKRSWSENISNVHQQQRNNQIQIYHFNKRCHLTYDQNLFDKKKLLQKLSSFKVFAFSMCSVQSSSVICQKCCVCFLHSFVIGFFKREKKNLHDNDTAEADETEKNQWIDVSLMCKWFVSRFDLAQAQTKRKSGFFLYFLLSININKSHLKLSILDERERER